MITFITCSGQRSSRVLMEELRQGEERVVGQEQDHDQEEVTVMIMMVV